MEFTTSFELRTYSKQLDSFERLGMSSNLGHLRCLRRKWDSGGAHYHFISSAMTGETSSLSDAMFGAYNGISQTP